MIRDNYEKIVIAGSCNNPVTQDGIKIVKLTDFLFLQSILLIAGKTKCGLCLLK